MHWQLQMLNIKMFVMIHVTPVELQEQLLTATQMIATPLAIFVERQDL